MMETKREVVKKESSYMSTPFVNQPSTSTLQNNINFIDVRNVDI